MSRAGTAAGLAGAALALVVLPAARARAADVTIAAGQEYTLTGDIVLTAGDNFQAGDPAGPRCTIHGGGHNIDATDGTWTGTIAMSNCDVDTLGSPGGAGIQTVGGHDITVVGSTFSKSASFDIVMMGGDTSITFRGNQVKEDSAVVIVNESLDQSQDAFHFKGGSTGTKVFQANTVRKSRLHFELTGDWLIGGDTPADGNILAGPRTGIFIDRCGPMTIRGNYSSTLGAGWNQVKNLAAQSPGGGPLLVEHNVFIGMSWNTEVNCPGEIRYNLFANPIERAWVQIWSAGGTKVHHNVLIQTDDSQANMIAGGFVVFMGDNTSMPGPPNSEIYNNTFDAGGVCNPGLAGAVMMDGLLSSLRSNAFLNIRLAPWTGTALVGQGIKEIPDPLPVLLGYTDYNLFHNPDMSVKANYNVGVAGKTLRTDAGFGLHDVPPNGAPNAQVDPKLANQTPHAFPFQEADVLAGTVNVCQILAFYRQAYTPAADSPLVDAGDPQEGVGNDIGAVGAGAENALDEFGRLCDPASVTPLVPPAGIYSCKSVAIGGTGAGGSGGVGVVPGDHHFSCVCDGAAGDVDGPSGGLLSVLAILASLAMLARTRPRAH
jgi:hypothetical protein